MINETYRPYESLENVTSAHHKTGVAETIITTSLFFSVFTHIDKGSARPKSLAYHVLTF